MPLAAENERASKWEAFEGSYRFNIEDLSPGRGGTDVDHERFTFGEFLDFGLFFVFAGGLDTE
jgi:hypothetical protein